MKLINSFRQTDGKRIEDSNVISLAFQIEALRQFTAIFDRLDIFYVSYIIFQLEQPIRIPITAENSDNLNLDSIAIPQSILSHARHAVENVQSSSRQH